MPTTTVAQGPNAASHKRRTTHYYTSNLRKRALCPDPGSAHVYHSPADSPQVPHPIRLFPAPRDHISQMWISKETKQQLSEYERVYPWVDGSEEEEHAGILIPAKDPALGRRRGTGAVQERQANVRRAWRLLTRRNLLDQEPLRPLETLRELRRARVGPLPSYVMVRSDVLAEHMHLEEKLRTDRASLREQCTWYFQDKTVSAREALPLMKIAIDEVCDREMASASSALCKLQTWVPHRANPLLLKAPMPLQASSSCTVATNLTAPTYTDHGSLTTATAGSLVGPPSHLHATSTSTSSSTGVRSRLLQRVRGLPLNARFGFGLDMLRQLEEDVSAHEMEAMGHEEALCRQAWRFVEAKERKADYELYYTLAHVFGVLSEQAFHRTHRPGNMYYTAMSNSARGFQRMWRRYWPPRKRRKLRGTIFVQTLFRAYRSRRRWRPIVLLRLKYGFRQQLAYRFDRWARITKARSTAHRRFREHQQALQRMVLDAWVRHALQFMRDRKERAEAMAFRKVQKWKRVVLRGWDGVTKNHKRIRRNFYRNVEFPYLRWWRDEALEQKQAKQARRFALGVQTLGRGYAARRRYQLIRRRKDLIYGCLRRRIAMTRLAKRQAAAHRSRVLSAVTWQKDMMAKALVELEEARRESLSAELRKADAAGRRNMWLSEGDIQLGLLVVRHDFESDRPPPFRPADPSRVNDTYVLAEHYETAAPLQAPFHLLLLDREKVLLLYNYLARTVGAGGLLWTLNFWRAVENLRAHRVDSAMLLRPMRSRLLQIVRKYLSPHCGNPATVSPNIADAAETAAKRLERLSVVTVGLRKAAAYGAVLQQLYAAQYEAFLVLLQEASGPFFATEEGKAYVREVEERRFAMWRKEEAGVQKKHWDTLLKQAREVKQEVQRRIKLKQVALDTKADLVASGITALLSDEIIGRVCDTYASLHNDLVEETAETAVHKATVATIRALILEAAGIAALDVKIENKAGHVVDNFVSDLVSELLLDDAAETAIDEYLEVLEGLAETAVGTAVEGLVEGLVEEGVTEVRTERALVNVQCWFRRRLALKAARRQVAQVLVKCWDPTFQSYYYMNTLTGEASWDRPVILQRLFPQRALQAAAAFSGGSFDHATLPEGDEEAEEPEAQDMTEGGQQATKATTLRRTETFEALPGSASSLRPSSAQGPRPPSRGSGSSSSSGHSSRQSTPPTPLAAVDEAGGLDGPRATARPPVDRRTSGNGRRSFGDGGPPVPSEEARASLRARRRSSNGQSMRPPTVPRPDAETAEQAGAARPGSAGGRSSFKGASAVVGATERPPSAGRGTKAARPPTPDKWPDNNTRPEKRADNARPPAPEAAVGNMKNQEEVGGKAERGNGIGKAEAGIENKAKKNLARAVV